MKTASLPSILFATLLAATGATALAQGPGAGYGPGSGKGPGAGPGPGGGPGSGMMHRGGWTRERMYGSPLMTLQERQQHMERMWNAKTPDERTRIRDEHRKLMQERARQQNFRIDEQQDDSFSVPAVK